MVTAVNKQTTFPVDMLKVLLQIALFTSVSVKVVDIYIPPLRWIIIIHRSGGIYMYPPLSLTLRWIIVLVYTTQAEYVTSGPKSNFICDNIPTKAILFFFGYSEVNSTWLITSELANQRAWKVLFTCAVHTKRLYLFLKSLLLLTKMQRLQLSYKNFPSSFVRKVYTRPLKS